MLFEDMDRIVFAGDSVTDMGSAQPVGEGLFDNLGTGYVRIIDNMLAAYYPERRIRVTNSGISGNTSRDLLERFQRDVVDLKPDWVSICIGINDVWRQFDTPAMPDGQVLPEEYERNVEQMILQVKGKVKGIFLLSPYYMEPNRDFDGVERLRKLAYEDLDAAVIAGCETSIQEMEDRGLEVHKNTLAAREWLLSKRKGTSDS